MERLVNNPGFYEKGRLLVLTRLEHVSEPAQPPKLVPARGPPAWEEEAELLPLPDPGGQSSLRFTPLTRMLYVQKGCRAFSKETTTPLSLHTQGTSFMPSTLDVIPRKRDDRARTVGFPTLICAEKKCFEGWHDVCFENVARS